MTDMTNTSASSGRNIMVIAMLYYTINNDYKCYHIKIVHLYLLFFC